MNYNKYVINKKKKNNYFLLIVLLTIVAIIYFIINSMGNAMPFKVLETFKDLNMTDSIDLEEDESAVISNSDVSIDMTYFLIGYYENEVNAFSEKKIESMPSIKINYDDNVFFLMKIIDNDEFDVNKISIEENKFSIIQFDLLNININDKLMNSILSSMKDIFATLTEEDIEAIKTEEFKNWVSSLPKEREDEENYDKLVNIRNQIANLKERMILEDCIGIIQTIIN